MVQLEAVRAKQGDCLLLHYGTEEQPRLSLIDGGPGGVWKPFLRPRLEQLREQRGGERLQLDMLMVSHIDDDHINGLIQMTRLLADQAGTADILLDATVVWHNSFDDVFGDAGASVVTGDTGTSVESSTASLAGSYDISDEGALMIASVPQGQTFRANVAGLGWAVNSPFDGLVTARPKPVKIPGGLQLTVLGPDQVRLDEFHEEWDKDLKERADKAKTAQYMDDSAWNLASIVVLAELDGRTLLLTGDGRGDDVIRNARSAGLLDARGTLRLDLLKLPHHGSINNVELDFFETFPASTYVVSGNGGHGNPKVEVFEMLFESRAGDNDHFDIYLTYDPEEYVAYHKKPYPIEALLELFARQKAAGRNFSVICPGDDDLSVTVPVGRPRTADDGGKEIG